MSKRSSDELALIGIEMLEVLEKYDLSVTEIVTIIMSLNESTRKFFRKKHKEFKK